MRDRSRARNYSASRDEFRRAHERHRAWGLQRRHSERMRQIREREAGCWPADLEALRGGVEDGQSGIADELTPGTARLLMRRDTRGRACDPPARSTEPARSVRQAGPARMAPPRAGERTAVKSCSPPSNHGRRQALALSREQAPGRDHAPAKDRVDVTTPRPPARPPRPGRAGEHQSRPTRSMVTRRARKLAADEQQSHGQNTRQKATLTLPGNVLNPHRAPPQHGRRPFGRAAFSSASAVPLGFARWPAVLLSARVVAVVTVARPACAGRSRSRRPSSCAPRRSEAGVLRAQ